MNQQERPVSLLKRGKWAWCDFSINDERYRLPLRNRKNGRIPYNADPTSSDYQSAILAAERLREDARAGKLAPRRGKSMSFARLPLGEALDRHIAERLPYLAPNSIITERQSAKLLKRYFGNVRVSQIDADGIREYVAKRASGELFLRKSEASPRAINMEVGLLRRLLKRAKRLHLLADDDIKP